MNALFQSLVAKPDQLIKRRGKLGLIKVKASLEEVKQWIAERMGKDQEVSSGQSIGFDIGTVLIVEYLFVVGEMSPPVLYTDA